MVILVDQDVHHALNVEVQVDVYVTIVMVRVLPSKEAPIILCYDNVFFVLEHVP